MKELIERIESASGPDRELDAMIWASTVNGYIEGRSIWYNDKGWVKTAVALGDGMVRERKRLGDPADAPAYSASIDAAVSLVPEGWRWMAGHREHPHARAYVENGAPAFAGFGSRRNPDQLWFEVTAATPALALCVASLRAHEVRNKETSSGD